MVRAALAFFISAQIQMAAAAPLTLSQKDAAELILKQGFLSQEINYRYQLELNAPYVVLSNYDWKLNVESGFERDKTKSYSLYSNPDYERYRTTLSLGKSLLTGTVLTFDYGRISQKQLSSGSLSTSTSTPPITFDSMNFTLEQFLWGNSFGVADRARINAVELETKATGLLRVDELENAVLIALKQFWNTYVAQENFREALSSRDRYEKLVTAVKRKTSFGYSNPGESAQVQAEFESRIQAVKLASTDYLRNLDALLTMLKLPPNTDIEFKVPEDIPPVPKLNDVAIDNLRSLRSQKLKVEAAEESYIASKSLSRPNLNFVGKLGSTGLDDSPTVAYNEAASGSAGKYYVGLKFQVSFGSGAQTQDVLNRRAAKELEKLRLERQQLEEKDKHTDLERKVSSTYAIAMSSKTQLQFREKAVQELTRSYNQGRTDISVLIEAMNKYFNSEVQYIRAIGDYQIALNEWAAQRDELIPEKKGDL